MPSFFEIKEGGWPMYALLASFAILMIGGASTIYYELIYDEPLIKTLMCTECGFTIDMPQEEFGEMVNEREASYSGDPCEMGGEAGMPGMPPGMPGMGPGMGGMMMRPWGQYPWALVCPECGGETLYSAIRCQECGKVFFRNQAGDQRYPDTCPDCGFSKHRQIQEERQAEDNAARERQREARENR